MMFVKSLLMSVLAAAAAPECTVTWADWEGARTTTNEYMTRLSETEWCLIGSGGPNQQKCFKTQGRGVTGKLTKNGDIDWSNGRTSKLMEKC